MLATHKFSGPKKVSNVIKWEVNPEFCRSQFKLAGGAGSARKILVGTLLALAVSATAVTANVDKGADNAGGGDLVLNATPTTKAVKPGDYTLTCEVAGADGVAKFRVEDPEGKAVDTAVAGTAFGKQIKFTINAAGADFAEGDIFIVTVSVDYQSDGNTVVEWNPDAEDGTQIIWGISRLEISAPDGEERYGGVADVRDCLIARDNIAWPEGISDAQMQGAFNQLEELRLIPR